MSWGGAKRIAKLRAAVIDAYGTECSICHRLIDLGRAWPDPECLTLDHVVPRSLGGSNNLANLRPAHKRCNEAKGARVAVRPGRAGRAARVDGRFF